MAKKKDKKPETAFDKLIDKHKLFVLNYIKHLYHATNAYLETYPNAKTTSAATKGSELLRKVNIKEAIEEKSAEQFADIMTETEKNKTVQLIKAIGDATINNIVDLENGTLSVKDFSEIPPEALHAIQSVEMDEKDGETMRSKNLKVKLHSKLQALKLRAEIQKIVDPDAAPREIIVVPAMRPDKEQE